MVWEHPVSLISVYAGMYLAIVFISLSVGKQGKGCWVGTCGIACSCTALAHRPSSDPSNLGPDGNYCRMVPPLALMQIPQLCMPPQACLAAQC